MADLSFNLIFLQFCFWIYYGSDEAVQEDKEVQAFVQDVCLSGMKNCPKSGGEYKIILLIFDKCVHVCASIHVNVNVFPPPLTRREVLGTNPGRAPNSHMHSQSWVRMGLTIKCNIYLVSSKYKKEASKRFRRGSGQNNKLKGVLYELSKFFIS